MNPMEPNELTEKETIDVSIEQVEENSSVDTVTVVNETLVHLLAKIAVRNDAKHQKRRPLYNLLGVFILAMAAYFAYTYFITKTNTTRGPMLMIVLVAMAGLLFYYINTPLIKLMEGRMRPYLGQAWNYSVSEDGVGLTLNEQSTTFEWEEIRGWWQEDGYYMMDVSGQAIAIKRDNLDQEDQEYLESLLYIYLGNELPVEQAEGEK